MALRVHRLSPGCERVRICRATANGGRRPRSCPRVIREEELLVDERRDSPEGFTKSLTPFALVVLEVCIDQRQMTLFGETKEQLPAIRNLRPVACGDIEQLGEMPGVSERVSRLCRRYRPTSVAPISEGATPV